MDSIESGHHPEHSSLLLTQGGLESLFNDMIHSLVVKGVHDTAPGLYTPRDRPEPLSFRVDLDPGRVKNIFYTNDDMIHIKADGAYLNYITPHALDKEEVDEPASSVYLGIVGELQGTDVSFITGYLLTREGNEDYAYLGEADNEFFSGGKPILEDEIIEVGGSMVLISSYSRGITIGDAENIRQLLDSL